MIDAHADEHLPEMIGLQPQRRLARRAAPLEAHAAHDLRGLILGRRGRHDRGLTRPAARRLRGRGGAIGRETPRARARRSQSARSCPASPPARPASRHVRRGVGVRPAVTQIAAARRAGALPLRRTSRRRPRPTPMRRRSCCRCRLKNLPKPCLASTRSAGGRRMRIAPALAPVSPPVVAIVMPETVAGIRGCRVGLPPRLSRHSPPRPPHHPIRQHRLTRRSESPRMHRRSPRASRARKARCAGGFERPLQFDQRLLARLIAGKRPVDRRWFACSA